MWTRTITNKQNYKYLQTRWMQNDKSKLIKASISHYVLKTNFAPYTIILGVLWDPWTSISYENHDPMVKWASKCDPTDNGSTLSIWRLIVHVNEVAIYFNYLEKIRNSTLKIIPLYSYLNLYNCQWICKKKELHVNEFPSYSLAKGKTIYL